MTTAMHQTIDLRRRPMASSCQELHLAPAGGAQELRLLRGAPRFAAARGAGSRGMFPAHVTA
jgi:hypothetical protein